MQEKNEQYWIRVPGPLAARADRWLKANFIQTSYKQGKTQLVLRALDDFLTLWEQTPQGKLMLENKTDPGFLVPLEIKNEPTE